MKRLILSLLAAATVASAADRPNFLWITSEDNSAWLLGCYGNKQAVTPNLDKLASEGVRYTHAYATAPVCAVARGEAASHTTLSAPSAGVRRKGRVKR